MLYDDIYPLPVLTWSCSLSHHAQPYIWGSISLPHQQPIQCHLLLLEESPGPELNGASQTNLSSRVVSTWVDGAPQEEPGDNSMVDKLLGQDT